MTHVPGHLCKSKDVSNYHLEILQIASIKPQTHKVGNCCAPLTLEFWSKSLVSCRVSRAKVPDFGLWKVELFSSQLKSSTKKNIYKTRLNLTSQPRIASSLENKHPCSRHLQLILEILGFPDSQMSGPNSPNNSWVNSKPVAYPTCHGQDNSNRAKGAMTGPAYGVAWMHKISQALAWSTWSATYQIWEGDVPSKAMHSGQRNFGSVQCLKGPRSA